MVDIWSSICSTTGIQGADIWFAFFRPERMFRRGQLFFLVPLEIPGQLRFFMGKPIATVSLCVFFGGDGGGGVGVGAWVFEHAGVGKPGA